MVAATFSQVAVGIQDIARKTWPILSRRVTKGHYIVRNAQREAGVTLEGNSQGDWTRSARLFQHGSPVCI